MSISNSSRQTPLTQGKSKVVGVRASLCAPINSSNSSTIRLISSQLDTLPSKSISIHIVQRIVNHSRTVRSTPDEFGSVGRVVVAILGQAVAVSLALEFLAVRAAFCGELLLSGGLVLTGYGEEDVLGAVVFYGGLAGEGGGGEGEDAGEGDGGEVHGCDVWFEEAGDSNLVWSVVFVVEKRGLVWSDDSCLLAGPGWSSYTFLTWLFAPAMPSHLAFSSQ
jgi:hypothetical protein